MPTFDLRSPADDVVSPRHQDDTLAPGPSPTAIMWEAPEYHVRSKPVLWYAGFSVVLAALLFVAFLMRSFLTGVVFGLLGFLILLYSERPPRRVRFSLSTEALTINERRYPMRELETFNVVDSLMETGSLLLIRSRRVIMPLVHVPLTNQDPETIRNLLRQTLREDPELRESLTDVLAHRLGF